MKITITKHVPNHIEWDNVLRGEFVVSSQEEYGDDLKAAKVYLKENDGSGYRVNDGRYFPASCLRGMTFSRAKKMELRVEV